MDSQRKTKGFKNKVDKLASLKEENAQLRKRIAILEKKTGASKPLDDYRRKMYNEMVDTIVEIRRSNHSRIYEWPIENANLDFSCRKSA